ncbi:MAG: chemotaxis protein CheA [Myxococcales bacterium]|nr:chemotaxis protein CheA [Myxococcales bacterium]
MDLSKYRQLYVSETQENLEKISRLLVELEGSPDDQRVVDTVFRLLHSIKGMSGTMGYSPVFELAHALEDLMDGFRRHRKPLTTAAIDVLLAAADRISQWVGDVELGHLPLRLDPSALALHERVETLVRLAASQHRPVVQAPPLRGAPPSQVSPSSPAPAAAPNESGDLRIQISVDERCGAKALRACLVHRKLGELGSVISVVPDLQALQRGELKGPLCLVLRTALSGGQVEEFLGYISDLSAVSVEVLGTPSVDNGLAGRLSVDDFDFTGDLSLTLPFPSRPPAPIRDFLDDDFLALGRTTESRATTTPQPIAFDLPVYGPDPDGSSEVDADGSSEVDLGGSPMAPEAAIVIAPRLARTVRVRTDWLDSVLNRTGDLLILSQRLWALNRSAPDSASTEALVSLSRVLHGLHDDAMSVRMTPMSVLTARLPRAARDLARRSGKRVQLAVVGDEQELDRAIIEGLDAPLTHLLNNAVEHGIESPEDRVAAGKSPQGALTVSCHRVRDEIVVEFKDDGAGIDRERLVNRAVELSLLSRLRAEELAARDVTRLICLPGLTSREEPGVHSGRGVGLDAVREMVLALGGRIEVESLSGEGTVVRLRLPRTPGIGKLLLVEAKGQAYAIPLGRVQTTEMLNSSDVGADSLGSLTISLNGEPLPLTSLVELLEGARPVLPERFPGVVCSDDDGPFVMAVDRVIGQQDAVIKPLGPLLERLDGLMGVTIDPVGNPVFVIDVSRPLAVPGVVP